MDLLRLRDELIITRISNGHGNDRFGSSVNGNLSDRLDWSLDILPILPKSNSGSYELKGGQSEHQEPVSLQESLINISSVEGDFSGSNNGDNVEPSCDDEDVKPPVEETECTTDMLPAAFCEATVVSREDTERHRSVLPDSTELCLTAHHSLFSEEGGGGAGGGGGHEERMKKFRCEDCNYSTDVSSHFRAHKRRHTGERPYACSQCSYRAAESCTLNRHKLTHTGAKRHQCPLCPYKAFLAGDVSKHMRCHTGERPYSCPLCPYRASRRSSVTEHLATHSSDKEHPCDICGHLSATRIQLRRHMKNKHFIPSSINSGVMSSMNSGHIPAMNATVL